MLDFLNIGGPFSQPAGCVLESAPGQTLSQFHPHLTEVVVDSSRDKASTATLTFAAPVDENGRWDVQDSDEIAMGEPIVISAKFSLLETVQVFEGFILNVTPSYPRDRGTATVTVQCRDNTLLLDREHRKETWPTETQMDDVTFVTKIAGENGLIPDPDNANGTLRFTHTQNNTDAAFMFERACKNGYEFYTRGKIVYFGPMRLSADPQPTIKIYAGRNTNCISFDIDHDGYRADSLTVNTAAAIGNGVETREVSSDLDLMGLDPAKREQAAMGLNHWLFDRNLTPNIEEAEALAQARVNEESMGVRASGELDGSLYGHVLQFGMPVGVSGSGERYDGTYYVDNVIHTFSNKGYRQKFKLIRNATGNDLASAASRTAAVLGG